MRSTHFYKFRYEFCCAAGKNSLKDISNSLRIERVNKLQLLTFYFLEFRFFWNSENGQAIFFSNPRLLKPLIAIPYMLGSYLYSYRGKRYFVKLKNQIVANFVLTARHDLLIVSSLGVSPDYRRVGVGFFILKWAEKVCRQMKAEWLELTVLKGNTPAQWLYQKFGFKITAERKISLTLRKRIQA
jgi:ribosomal protein S18 acetylase RimI-like enzyme